MVRKDVDPDINKSGISESVRSAAMCQVNVCQCVIVVNCIRGANRTLPSIRDLRMGVLTSISHGLKVPMPR